MSVIVREGQAVVLHYSNNWYLEGKVSGLNKITWFLGLNRDSAETTLLTYNSCWNGVFLNSSIKLSRISYISMNKPGSTKHFYGFRDKVDDQVWRFLLTGGVALENPYPNPCTEWLSEKAWSEIVRASDLPNLKGLKDSEYLGPLQSQQTA